MINNFKIKQESVKPNYKITKFPWITIYLIFNKETNLIIIMLANKMLISNQQISHNQTAINKW